MKQCSYTVQHCTEFFYSQSVRENILILSMKPLQDEKQKLDWYKLSVSPKAEVFSYQDQYGNTKQIFNILSDHQVLKIHSSFQVVVKALDSFPDQLNETAWEDLDQLKSSGQMWDWLQPGYFTRESDQLNQFLMEEGIERQSDPLSGLKNLNAKLFSSFTYCPKSTNARSAIEEILTSKKGVCQDYSHVMITIARLWGVPSRYVSGYLYDDQKSHITSSSHESHAWCECYLPSLGWLGFDPTNNRMAGIQHIRTAIGKDYKDIPPHKGFFKGGKTDKLKVSVTVKTV